MKRFNLHNLGRFGNNLFAYAFARGYCERHGLELHVDPWVGDKLFDISHPRCDTDLPRRDENTLVDGEGDISYRSYSQCARCASYYSLSQIREWFKFRPEIDAALTEFWFPHHDWILAHVRRGDYVGENSIYPLVSRQSYEDACLEHGLSADHLHWVEEEKPATHIAFTGEMDFVPDFWRMSKARVLLRANSSFSFWAGAIGQATHGARVFSPVVDGLTGNKEHHVRFVESNSPRIADLGFVQPIKIAP